MLQRRLDLDNKAVTPFTLVLVIYRARLALRLAAWEQLDLSKQCEYLLSHNINHKLKRKKVITDLIEKENNFGELKHKSYLRIHIKHCIARYYKQSQLVSNSNNIDEWTAQDMIVSFLSHLIGLVQKDENLKTTSHLKVWEFVNYLRKYFDETHYDGHAFLQTFGAKQKGKNSDKPMKGFGLQIMKTVCNKYGLKSGPYSKVKKQCNIWASKIYQRSQFPAGAPSQIQSQSQSQPKPQSQLPSQSHSQLPSQAVHESKQKDPKPKYSGNWSKFVTQIPADYNDPFAGKSWFWFNDSGGYKWIPYRQVDIKKLNKAWTRKEKACLIMNDGYRVEFDYSNKSNPSGNQYNNKQANAGGRTVICGLSNSTDIHGISVSKQPL